MGASLGSRAGHGGPASVRPVRVSVESAIGRLTIDRVDKRNALDLSGIECLRDAMRQLSGERGLRSVIVEGAGEGVFCAGLEFGDIVRIDGCNNPFTAACDELAALPLPTVCTVGDGAYGAGADLALACDFRVGTPECRVRVPAAQLGVHYDGSGIARAVRTIGMQGARRMFLAAEALLAEDLLRMGFLDEIVPRQEICSRVERRARGLAALAPDVVRDLKRSIAEIAAGSDDAAVILERVVRSWLSEDFREGATARAEKRRPRFLGGGRFGIGNNP